MMRSPAPIRVLEVFAGCGGLALADADAEPWTNPEPPHVPRLVPNYPDRAPRLRCTGNGVCTPVAEAVLPALLGAHQAFRPSTTRQPAAS